MRYYDFINFFSDLFERLFNDKENRNYLDNVPQYCRQCELLGIYRDKENHWKCHNGCMVLSSERKKHIRK